MECIAAAAVVLVGGVSMSMKMSSARLQAQYSICSKKKPPSCQVWNQRSK